MRRQPGMRCESPGEQFQKGTARPGGRSWQHLQGRDRLVFRVWEGFGSRAQEASQALGSRMQERHRHLLRGPSCNGSLLRAGTMHMWEQRIGDPHGQGGEGISAACWSHVQTSKQHMLWGRGFRWTWLCSVKGGSLPQAGHVAQSESSACYAGAGAVAGTVDRQTAAEVFRPRRGLTCSADRKARHVSPASLRLHEREGERRCGSHPETGDACQSKHGSTGLQQAGAVQQHEQHPFDAQPNPFSKGAPACMAVLGQVQVAGGTHAAGRLVPPLTCRRSR